MKRGLIILVFCFALVFSISSGFAEEFIFPNLAESYNLATDCDADNLLEEDGAFAGLGYAPGDLFDAIDGKSVTSCIVVNFDLMNISKIRIRYTSSNNACGDSCIDPVCNTGGGGRVFVKQGDNLKHVDNLPRNGLISKDISVDYDNVDEILVCRDGNGHARDNLLIDYVAVEEKVVVPEPDGLTQCCLETISGALCQNIIGSECNEECSSTCLPSPCEDISDCIDEPEPEPICVDMCGNDVCEEVVCLGEGCPCAETLDNCAADCTIEPQNDCEKWGGKCTSPIRGCGHYEEYDLECSEFEIPICCSEIPYCGDGVCFKHDTPNYGENITDCPEDCLDVCSGLIDRVKNPSDFSDYGNDFRLSWNNSWEGNWWIDGKKEKYIEYGAGWYSWNDLDNYNFNYDVMIFENEGIELKQWLEQRTSYQVCKTRNFWSADNKENRVYICNWDILREEQDLGNWNSQSREVFWTNENVAVRVYLSSGKYLTDEEILKISQKRFNDFLDDLKDNQYEYVSWEYFDFDWPLENQISFGLGQCPSELKLGGVGTCNPSWECKIEPVICPPHGYQTKTCIDNNCDSEDKEDRKYCNPGICSGCYVPQWFGSKWESKCIPYGMRFEQQTGWTERLEERKDDERLMERNSGGDYSLIVESEDGAVFTIFYDGGESNSYDLVLGEEVVIDVEGWEELEELSILVEDINFVEAGSEDNYIDTIIKFTEYRQEADIFNAYCDIDGDIKVQKQDWTKCQNSYECDSNLCSGHECTGINQMIQNAGRFKSILVRIMCRLGHMFSEANYDQCLVDYLS